MSDHEMASRIIELIAQVGLRDQQIADLQRYYLQTMLTITVLAGGEIRLGKLDFEATRGYSLATFVDPKTGDRVFVAKDTTPPTQEPLQ